MFIFYFFIDLNANDNNNNNNNNTIAQHIGPIQEPSTTTTRQDNSMINLHYNFNAHKEAYKVYKEKFTDNKFGYVCFVCDRLWFKKDLQTLCCSSHKLIIETFPEANLNEILVCRTCDQSLRKNNIPLLSKSNGFVYPPIPSNLPKLDLISERLISPRLPFVQIRRLRNCHGQYGILGQVINVPVSVNNMVTSLPRNLNDDYCINVHIKRRSIHKSSYLKGLVQKRTIKLWLNFLISTPLYQHFSINIDESFFNENFENPHVVIEDVAEPIPVNESLVSQQQTMLWSDEMYLNLAPGERNAPISLIFDEFAEELSFPSIYAGQFRVFRDGLHVTPFMIATSEIRRADRRGVTPHHILYLAMKIMRFKVRDSLVVAFKHVGHNTNITREQIQSTDYINGCLERNLAFLRSIPNSTYYWHMRKRDLFAMIRQFGKPDIFLTLSANEIGWNSLLQILYKYQNGSEISEDEASNLNYIIKTTLVNEDPVTCVLYFNKMVDTILNLLQSKKFSPFGKYYVVNYFKRIEFQHRGSPHAHILLWLNNAPKDPLGNDKLATIEMINSLISVSESDSSGNIKLQSHKHTFTCYKNKSSKRKQDCRFEAPFWPCRETIILIPMSSKDKNFRAYRKRYKEIWENLENNDYNDFKTFCIKNKIESYDYYLNVLRAGIKRPKIFLKRNLSEKWINPFNPFIFSILQSNMDIQFITEEYSCATYVVEYVNKTNRGISDLQRKILQVMNEYPDFDIVEITKKLSIDMLNSVEISSQEAAWYLLRLPMSKSSIAVTFIPTMWPVERERLKRSRKEMDEMLMEDDSVDIWKHNCFDKYQKRSAELDDLTLAQFVAFYTVSEKNNKCVKRKIPRVIRYRNYDAGKDLNEYKREMVTLHIPFRSEEEDILADMKFINIYNDNEDIILNRRKVFESDLDMAKTMEICRRLCQENSDINDNSEEQVNRGEYDADPYQELYNNPNAPNNADLQFAIIDKLGVIAKRRENLIPNEQFYSLMRMANEKQMALLTHVIFHLTTNNDEPLHLFLSGPAGCGKTFVIRLLMEIYNRFTNTDNFCNAYITCASTGKAAVAIDGCTVHTALKISISRNLPLSFEVVQLYRTLFKYIKVIIIDEVSMISAELLYQIDGRLKQITNNYNLNFGGLDVIFIGDLRQLPPVRATPIYKQIKRRIVGPSIWRQLSFHELDEVMRQSNLEFSNLLTKIGNLECLNEDEQKLIESRFFSKDEVNHLCPNGIRIFLKNTSVSQYNSTILNAAADKVTSIATDLLIGCHNVQQEASFRQVLHKKTVIDTGGLPYEISFVIGKPYLITTNIDVSDGLANGALGRLCFIEYCNSTRDQIKRVWLEFPESPNIGLKIRAKVASYVQLYNISRSAVPFAMKNCTIALNANKTVFCKRSHFPLIPACAMTIHKSQGGTFSEVVYEYERSHIRSLVYVALSRVTNINGLFITTPNNDNKFYHGRMQSTSVELINEFKRLSLNRLSTIYQHIFEFINNRKDISIMTLNCQSIRAHNQDLSDKITQSCNFLLLSETWLYNDEEVNIPNFNCIVKYKRQNVRSGGVAIFQNSNKNTHVITPYLDISHRQVNHFHVDTQAIGDICVAECILNSGSSLLMAVIYISPNHSVQNIIEFIHFALLPYSIAGSTLLNKQYHTYPMIFSGDFNINFTSEEATPLIEFLKNTFNLSLNTSRNTATTRGGTTIDAVFERNLPDLKSEIFVSYFSYHKPIISCKPLI